MIGKQSIVNASSQTNHLSMVDVYPHSGILISEFIVSYLLEDSILNLFVCILLQLYSYVLSNGVSTHHLLYSLILL